MAKAMAIGTDSVIAWVETNIEPETPFYSVWQGSNLLYSSVDADYDKAINSLRENIDAAAENNFDDILKLQLHQIAAGDKNRRNRIHEKKTVIASLYFRAKDVVPSGYIQPYIPQQNNKEVLAAIEGISERLTALEEDELEQIPGEAGAINEPAKFDAIALLNTFLSHPQIQNKIVSVIGGFLDKIVIPTQQQNIPMPQTQINGIADNRTIEDKLNYVLNTLLPIHPNLVEDLVKLADLSKTDPGKIQAILSFLPK